MAVKQETYGLPDESLQLIASSPDFGFLLPQQGTTAQFATPDVRRSDLISALRNIPGSTNPGFTRYANQANGAALAPTARKPLNVLSPARLTLPKYVAPEITLPGGDVQTPAVMPDPVVLPPDIIFNAPVTDPFVIDPDPVEPDPVTPDPVIPDPETPDPVDPDPVDPDWIDPTEIDPADLDPLVIPDVPEKEKTGTVEITPVDPDEETPQDDGTTEGILDEINSWPVNPPESTPDPEPEPEAVVPEPEPVVPEPSVPEPEPEPEPSLRDEIVKAIETQPQPEPEPVASTPDPVAPEPAVPEPDPYVPDPYVPELDPYVPEIDPFLPGPSVPDPEPEPTAEEVALIDAWLTSQFGGGTTGGGKAMFDDTLGVMEL